MTLLKIASSLLCIFHTLFSISQTTHYVVNTNDDGIGSLRNAVSISNSGDSVRFDPILLLNGNATIILQSEIEFSKSLTFKGVYTSSDTVFVSGNNACRIFNVSDADSLILDSMFLINGSGSTNVNVYGGGAIRYWNNSNPIVYKMFNSMLRNNKSLSQGGAIDLRAANSSATTRFFSSVLSDNQALQGSGGGVNCVSSLYNDFYLTNTKIINNSSNMSGSGVNFFGYDVYGTVTNSNVSGNGLLSNNSGGGISINATNKTLLKLNNSEFVDNVSVIGAALYISANKTEVQSIGNSFTENWLNESIFINSFDSTLVLIDSSSFVDNNSNCVIKIIGVYVDVQLLNSVAMGNYGEIIYCSGTKAWLFIANSNLTDNSPSPANSVANLHSTDSSYMKILKSTISNSNGNAIYCTSTAGNASVNLVESKILNNYGGFSTLRVMSKGIGFISIDKSTVAENNYGGVWCSSTDSSAIVEINHSTINGNTGSSHNGAGIYAHSNDNSTHISISHSTISENSTPYNGGGIASDSPNDTSIISIVNSTILNNKSSNSVNGIHVDAAHQFLNVESSIVYNPFANSSGSININCPIISHGYNVFNDDPVGNDPLLDFSLITVGDLNLDTLNNNGGLTKTHLPLQGSIVINAGNPLDNSDAQNASIYLRREIGSTESVILANTSLFTSIINNNFVYPNPTKDIIQIISLEPSGTLILYDLSGNLIWSCVISANDLIDLSFLSTGVYLIDFITNDTKYTTRLVKND